MTNNYHAEWSVPAKMLRPLLETLQSDLLAAGIEWKGDSETLKEYLQTNHIDPKVDSRYRRFYVNECHTASVSYTWRGTRLFEIVAKAELPENLNELVWIDVLVVSQFSISSSDQVVGTTDGIYHNCKVWVFLDNEYLGRAWCLAETGQYTNPESGCAITVYGQAELKPGTDFLGCMDAGAKQDLPLIEKYILGKYKSKEAFNHTIDCAVLRLSPLSLIYQGRYDEALHACEEEIGMLQASESQESISMVKAKATLGTVFFRLRKYECAVELLQDALTLCRESELELLGDITNRMGTVFVDMGRYTDAIQMLTESLNFRTRCFGSEHINVAATYKNMGIVEDKLENFQKALDLYQKALDIEIKSLGGAHVRVGNTYVNMGVGFSKLCDYEKALFHYQKALEIFKKSLGDSHASVASTYCNMGVVYEKLEDFQNALEMYEKVLEIAKKSLGDSHVSVAATEKNIGNVFLAKGDYEHALLHYQKALEIEEKSLSGAHVSVADTKYNMALVYERQGATAQARRLFGEAGAIYSDSYGATHSKALIALQHAQ